MPSHKRFVIFAGTDRSLSLVARDADGDILNLTSATLAFRLARNPGDTAIVSASGSIVSASAGTFIVTLTDSQTDDLDGDYYFSVLASISGTDTMCAEGIIRVNALNQA
jgi:tRNA A37 threonylcarbamoyladenosine synthetase subunit TsaC/SUA5/YrdC